MNALLVKHGIITRITLTDEDVAAAAKMHELIGNWFTTCFNVPGVGSAAAIIGYCDDEGLLTDWPDWNVIPDGSLRLDHQPIAGPIVIAGVDSYTGESRSLLDVEMDMFSIEPSPVAMRVPEGVRGVPYLTFKRLG